MKFTTQTPLHRKIATLFLKLYNYVENNDDANIHKNGELNFLKELSLFFSSEEKLIFFDVGANVGKYTETLLSLFPARENISIHLFEPLPACINLLNKKFSERPNLQIVPLGVSDKEAELTLYFNDETSSHASLYKASNLTNAREQTIKVIPLQKYIKENAVSHIHLLKIDVEGNDYKALLGLGEYLHSDFIDFIQFEYGPLLIETRTFLKDFYQLLEARGFCIAKIMRNSLHFRPWERRLENFTYANYVAVSRKHLQNTDIKHCSS